MGEFAAGILAPMVKVGASRMVTFYDEKVRETNVE
jgi:hypothetical protein